ncbi:MULTISPECIES: TetR/AcrR family transcriptional regulator [Halococcus]|uniref:DNA binding protein putative transcriptional regulator n=1 Tax=Halococcus salifodinae DSM 8989 TaxID=1227456 RepID=M0N7G8_9EURY|nr:MULTISPECIES: TetR/AcrR family transcriptional regulator [Halococcus]EMA52610.1 DNA binding protein putative transcriptional regulator [Halococcus salifodinae DSM 8989]
MSTSGTDREAVDTGEEIMVATYRALSKHGYANLTMQAIADEFEKTKAVIHYHFDTKDDLLVAFLDYLLDRFTERLAVGEDADPNDRLDALVDELLLGLGDDDEATRSNHEFHAALLELRSQAPHNDAYRAQLTTNYELLVDMLTAVIDDGIEQGVFHDVDAEQTATLVLATMLGGRVHHVTLDHENMAVEVRDALEAQVLRDLRVPERT